MKRFIEANPKKKNITQEILDFDKKNHAAQVKENMKPFEVLFFDVGAEILKNIDSSSGLSSSAFTKQSYDFCISPASR